MDQLYYVFVLAAVGTILISLVLCQPFGAKDKRSKLPPGPWKLPVVGSLHHLVGTLPHHALLRLSRRYGPVMLLSVGQVSTVVVSTPEAAMEVLKTNDLVFASRPSRPTSDVVSCGGKGIVFTPYGERWRQMRKICVVEVLSARQVRRIDSIKQDEIANLVSSIVATSSASPAAVINLSKAMVKLTNNIIARAVFGGKCQQQETYLRELHTLFTLVGGFHLVDLFPSSRLVRLLSRAGHLGRCHSRIQRILGDILVERKEKELLDSAGSRGDEDLLDVLLRLQKEDTLNFPLTSDIIGAVIFDIFAAATDSMAATLEWTMAELIRNPEVMARAKLEVRQSLGHGRSTITSAELDNLHYLRMVIKETLRLHPPGTMIRRASQAECQVMGYNLPKGTTVTINVFAVGRDPTHWGADAAEFRPERFEGRDTMNVKYSPGPQMEFIPFGAGRRQCPGALLATTTIELVLANLLYQFDWAIPGGASPETLDMGEVFGLIVHCRSNLCLQAATRHPQLH